jgi:VanZ family protein
MSNFRMRTYRLGGLAVLTLIVLSVLPGNMRPHVLGNDYYEHFAAYFITGSLWAMGYLRPTQLLLSGVLLAMCAGSLEFVQLWIPGRTASAGEFATGTIGAWIGFLVIIVVRRAHDGVCCLLQKNQAALQNCDGQGSHEEIEAP